MKRLRTLVLLVFVSTPLVAQQQPGGASPINDVLVRSRNALNDLRYREADSLAQLVIALANIVTKQQQIQALQISAAALFPEDGGEQRLQRAVSSIRLLAALDSARGIPRELSWSGLDSLYAMVIRGGQFRQLPLKQTGTLQINPLGFLQFGPNLEFERAVNRASGLSLGVRLASLGALTQALDSTSQSAWTVTGVWRFYPAMDGFRGWFIGPRVEVGRGTSTDYTSNLFAGAFDFGYRWIRSNGFSISVGGQAGVIADQYKHRTLATDTGTDIYPFAMFVVYTGIAF